MDDLGNKYALAALRDKRARLAGEIVALRTQIGKKKEQLGNLDATLQLFDEGYLVGSIQAKRTYQRVRLFKRGELQRTILGALRKATRPLALPELVGAILSDMGLDGAARPALTPRIRTNLCYLKGRGSVARSGQGTGTRWLLTKPSASEPRN